MSKRSQISSDRPPPHSLAGQASVLSAFLPSFFLSSPFPCTLPSLSKIDAHRKSIVLNQVEHKARSKVNTYWSQLKILFGIFHEYTNHIHVLNFFFFGSNGPNYV